MSDREFNGERLKSARLYNGLTLQDLANKTDLSKQAISLYENGRNSPDYMNAHNIAEVLGFPVDHFFQKDTIKTVSGTTYFRSLDSTSKKDRTSQCIKLEWVAKMYQLLLEYLVFPTYEAPAVVYDTFERLIDLDTRAAVDAMDKVADEVRKKWNVGEGPVDDVQYLLEKNGIVVTGFSTDEEKIDAFSQRIIVGNKELFLVAVAIGKRPQCRLRFDMAHELGHIILHPWSEDIETLSKEEFNVREKQANMFASALLLPREAFSKDVVKYPISLQYYLNLKKKWKVSVQAMIYRARQLEIITANQYQYLMRQVSKNGWRKNEPGDIVGDLNSNIFQTAVDCVFNEKIFTAKTLLQEFRRGEITLYPSMIEQLLHLEQGTLAVKDNVIALKVEPRSST